MHSDFVSDWKWFHEVILHFLTLSGGVCGPPNNNPCGLSIYLGNYVLYSPQIEYNLTRDLLPILRFKTYSKCQ